MKPFFRTTLALLALVAGVLAAVAGDVAPPLAADEVSAVELAGWLRSQRPGILVLDARDAEAFDRDRLPGARLLADVDADAIGSADVVVVYDDARAGAGILRGLSGAKRALRLHGGIAAWNDEVIFPVLRSDASASTQRDFAPRAMLSRYFGGSPRVLEPGAPTVRVHGRRGC